MTSTCTWKFSGISRENCVYTVGNPCEAIFQASKQAECLSLLTPRCLKSCPIQDTFSIQFKLLSAPMFFLLTRASAQQHTTALSRLKYLPKRPQLFSALAPCIFMVTAAQSDAIFSIMSDASLKVSSFQMICFLQRGNFFIADVSSMTSSRSNACSSDSPVTITQSFSTIAAGCAASNSFASLSGSN